MMPHGQPWQEGGFVARLSQAPPQHCSPQEGREERTPLRATKPAQLHPCSPISRTRSALPSRTLGASQSPLLPALGLRAHLLTGTVTQPGTGSWGGVGQRAAWQEDFLTSGLGLQRTLELPGCTGVILVLALSSWAGSRHSKPVFRCGAGTLSRSLRQEWSPRVI